MKKIALIITLASFVIIAGCAKKPIVDVATTTGEVATGTVEMTGTVETNTGTTTTVPTAWTDVKIVADQKANREGKKVGGAHTGTVALLPESTIQVNSDGTLIGGVIIAALNQITNSDLTDTGMNAKLVEHLKSADFFDTAKNPTAVFKATKVEASNVTADVTIRGVTKTLTFPVTLTKDNEGYLLSAKINISRADFGIGDTLAGKVALEDTFTLMLDNVAFMR